MKNPIGEMNAPHSIGMAVPMYQLPTPRCRSSTASRDSAAAEKGVAGIDEEQRHETA
jgi:hypothetical protein